VTAPVIPMAQRPGWSAIPMLHFLCLTKRNSELHYGNRTDVFEILIDAVMLSKCLPVLN
jgi:hypothetical protein